jgi:hypothetical protein
MGKPPLTVVNQAVIYWLSGWLRDMCTTSSSTADPRARDNNNLYFGLWTAVKLQPRR